MFREISEHLLGPDVYIDEIYGSSRELGEDIGNLAKALQAVLDIVESRPHQVNDEDCWYTCPQAKDEDGEWATCNDGTAGSPCDCGRDYLVKLVRKAIAESLGGEP